MIGFALVLIPVGYVMAYTGLAGDGTAAAGQPKTFSLGTAFKNALAGTFTHDPLTQGGIPAHG